MNQRALDVRGIGSGDQNFDNRTAEPIELPQCSRGTVRQDRTWSSVEQSALASLLKRLGSSRKPQRLTSDADQVASFRHSASPVVTDPGVAELSDFDRTKLNFGKAEHGFGQSSH